MTELPPSEVSTVLASMQLTPISFCSLNHPGCVELTPHILHIQHHLVARSAGSRGDSWVILSLGP